MITAVILTRDEALHIDRCIDRLGPLADKIIVVDSFSTDDTVARAEAAGAEVWQHRFENYSKQLNWALDRIGKIDGWVLRVDADEWFEPAAIAEIRRKVASVGDDVTALDIRRKVIFKGRFIRFGGYYTTVLTRLWRPGAARMEQRWQDEHIVVQHGRVERVVSGDVVDENLKDITDWTDKHNVYTIKQMMDFINLEYPLMKLPDAEGELSAGARRKRVLRNGAYARAPLYLRPMLYFLWRYFIRLGFLDGRQGLVFHTLQGFWNFFLIDVKVAEAHDYIGRHGLDAFREHLAERYGMRVVAPDA